MEVDGRVRNVTGVVPRNGITSTLSYQNENRRRFVIIMFVSMVGHPRDGSQGQIKAFQIEGKAKHDPLKSRYLFI